MNTLFRFDEFIAWGAAGMPEQVDRLMSALDAQGDLATTKLVDYALSLVSTPEGIARLEHYLFDGSGIQQNYAALYFKRKGKMDLLEQAFAAGKIDAIQIYAQ